MPASSKMRNAAFVLALLAMLTNVFVLAAPYWRTTYQWSGAAVVTNIWEFEGLFLSCVKEAQQITQCFQLQMFMGTTGGYNSGYTGYIYTYLNAFRALMIIAFIASLIGVTCSVLGMRCASVIEEDGTAKRWVLIIGGICHILSAVLTGVCVSWYAAEVVNEYYNPLYQTQKLKYTLGACLYVGWVAMLFSLVTGCLMACCTCFNKPVDDNYKYSPNKAQYSYKPPEPITAHERDMPYETKQTMQYDRRSDYYGKSSSRRHERSSRHSSRDRGRESSRRDDSIASSVTSHSSDDRGKSAHGGSRHDSDLMRASGFV